MPKVGNKKFPYTTKGKAQARREAALRARKMDRSKRPRTESSFNVEKEYAAQKAGDAKHRKHLADLAKKADHTGPTSGKDLMKFGGGASQSTFNVKKEYAKQKAGDERLAQGPTPHEVFESDKKAKRQEAKFQSKLKETRYLADAKAAREGVLDLTGTKAPPLPKNWRTLDKNSGIRQLFREWYKQNRGKKAKTKKPKINIKSHIARLEKSVGVKPGQLR